MPLGFAFFPENTIYNWSFATTPQPHLKGRSGHLPRGRTLGGTSSINGMLYVRGNPADFDIWAQMGCRGWSWSEVLPYFKRAEHNERGADEWHGRAAR